MTRSKPHRRYARLSLQPKRHRWRSGGRYVKVKCRRKHLGTPANQTSNAAYGFTRKGCRYLGTDSKWHKF